MLALAAGMAAFAVNDVLVKFAAQDYPLGEVIVVRGLFTIALVGGVLVALGHAPALRNITNPPLIGRTLLDAVAVLCFTAALVHMPLANLSAINLTVPLIITALAVVIYKEPVGWRRWTASAVGFAGTLFVVKPTPASFDVWALLRCVAFVSPHAISHAHVRRHPDHPDLSCPLAATSSAVPAAGQWLPMLPRRSCVRWRCRLGLAIPHRQAFRGVTSRGRAVPLHVPVMGRDRRLRGVRRGSRPLRLDRRGPDLRQRPLRPAPRTRAPAHHYGTDDAGRLTSAPGERSFD